MTPGIQTWGGVESKAQALSQIVAEGMSWMPGGGKGAGSVLSPWGSPLFLWPQLPHVLNEQRADRNLQGLWLRCHNSALPASVLLLVLGRGAGHWGASRLWDFLAPEVWGFRYYKNQAGCGSLSLWEIGSSPGALSLTPKMGKWPRGGARFRPGNPSELPPLSHKHSLPRKVRVPGGAQGLP